MDEAPQFLQLQPDDDVITACDRLKYLRGQRVALVWPEDGSVLTRKLDLVRVQREAMRNNVRLALVTHDTDVARHAAELNISAFETISGSQRSRWKRGRSRNFVNRSRRPIRAPLPDELAPYASRVRTDDVPLSPARRALGLAGRILVVALLAAGLLALLYLIVPSATVTIVPARQAVAADLLITADPSLAPSALNVEQAIMPAITYRAEVEEHGTLPTSGRQTLSSVPAGGSVTFINRTGQSVSIPAGALVSSSAGTPILFRTLQDVTVAAGAGVQADVPIEAVPESAGDIGNVEAGLINTVIGPLADQVEVRNFAPTFGGETRSTGIVTAEDRDTLISVLRQQIQDRAYRELLPMASSGQVLLPETLRLEEERTDWMEFDHQVGDAADSLSLTMRAVVAMTAIEEELARQIALSRLSSQVDRGREIDTATLEYLRGAVTGLDPSGQVTFAMSAAAEVQADVDASSVRNRIAGMTLADAQAYLAQTLDLQPGTAPLLSIQPDWLDRLPALALRISVAEQQAASG